MILRLVRQFRETHYGDVPLEHIRYILQSQTRFGNWETLPIVEFDDLPETEKMEIQRTLAT